MKNLIYIFLFFGIALLYISCSDNNPSSPQLNQTNLVSNTLDKKPAANLVGVMELTYVGAVVSWTGTITFEDYGTFEINFYGSPESEERGKSFHFVERFEILDGGVNIVLAVSDEGIEPGNLKADTFKYMSNGIVTDASAPFEMWLDRNTHMSGIIDFDEDGNMIAPGILRIN